MFCVISSYKAIMVTSSIIATLFLTCICHLILSLSLPPEATMNMCSSLLEILKPASSALDMKISFLSSNDPSFRKL